MAMAIRVAAVSTRSDFAMHADASVALSAACVPLGHSLGSEAPTGQKKPEGQMRQLDCVWLEQLDEYDPAAQAKHVPLMAWHPGQQQKPQLSLHRERGGGEGPGLVVEGGGAAVEEGGRCVVVAGAIVDGTAVVYGAEVMGTAVVEEGKAVEGGVDPGGSLVYKSTASKYR